MEPPVPLRALSADLDAALERAAEWTWKIHEAIDALTESEKRKIASDGKVLAKMRKRASSSLLNIAMFGAYSSGKSLLVSGLQERLVAKKVVTATGKVAERYIGLLPSAPTPTSCCPASVVPESWNVKEDGHATSVLRVRFVDKNGWEEIATSPASFMVASYAMDDVAYVEARREQDYARRVAEIELGITQSCLPVKLYDLPGYGTENKAHDEIVRYAVDDADYLIYVTSANRTLSPEDLTLIRFLYTHFTQRGKRVIWVVSGIDRADELGMDNRYAWQSTVEKNNQYLDENFNDKSFIGEGFIGVSAVLEAKGRRAVEEGNNEDGQTMLVMSQMALLRGELERIVRAETGLPHLRTVAAEAYELVYPYLRRIIDLLLAEQLPIESLEKEQDRLRIQADNLNDAVANLPGMLEAALRRHVSSLLPGFKGLHKRLHDALDQDIEGADLTSNKKYNSIETKRIRVVQEWINAPGGPKESWSREESRYRDYVRQVINTKLVSARAGSQLLPPTSIELDRLFTPRPQASRSDAQGLLQKAAGVLSVMSGGTSAAGLIVAGLFSVPVTAAAGAVAVAGALTYSAIALHRRKTSSLEVLRSEYKNALGASVDESRDRFIAAATLSATVTINRAVELLAEEEGNIWASIRVVEDRMADPDNVRRQAAISTFEPLVSSGRTIIDELKAI